MTTSERFLARRGQAWPPASATPRLAGAQRVRRVASRRCRRIRALQWSPRRCSVSRDGSDRIPRLSPSRAGVPVDAPRRHSSPNWSYGTPLRRLRALSPLRPLAGLARVNLARACAAVGPTRVASGWFARPDCRALAATRRSWASGTTRATAAGWVAGCPCGSRGRDGRRSQSPLRAFRLLSGMRASKSSTTARRCCSRNSAAYGSSPRALGSVLACA